MRILLVEDKLEFAAIIEKRIEAIDGCDVIWKQSRASALAALDDEPFDVVLLDRRIIAEDGDVGGDANHGWDVFQSIRERLPGTAVWFLTATEDADFSTDVLNEHCRTGDIHCCGREESIDRVFWKRRVDKCITDIRRFRAEVERTEAVSLSKIGDQVNLRFEEERLLKLFARKHGGTSVQVRPLSGGLAGARVLLAAVRNSAGQPVITSVAKIGGFEEIGVERTRYYGEIARLIPGSTPQITGDITFGASGHAGIFYAVVGAEVVDLFTKLSQDPVGSVEVPDRLRAVQRPWFEARHNQRVRVGAIRRRLIKDVELANAQSEFEGIDITGVESIEVDVAQCVQHGDLHCGNVLFDGSGHPMIIDYPNTGVYFASLDPLVLELCTIFHKNAPDRHGWPSETQAFTWPDIDAFAAGCPFEDYLRACRDWAVSAAASHQEVCAVSYGYALRQLKYPDTDKALARGIIQSCIAALTGAAA